MQRIFLTGVFSVFFVGGVCAQSVPAAWRAARPAAKRVVVSVQALPFAAGNAASGAVYAGANKAESALRRAVLARGVSSLRYAPFNSFLTPQLRQRYAGVWNALRLLGDAELLSERAACAAFSLPQEEVLFLQWPALERALVRYEMIRELAYLRGLNAGAERGEGWRQFMENARVISPDGEKRTVLEALRDPQWSSRVDAWMTARGYGRDDLAALTPVDEEFFARRFAAWRENAMAQTGALDVLQARLERPYWHPSFSADRLEALHDELERLKAMTDAGFVRWVDQAPYRASYNALADKVMLHWDSAVKSLNEYTREKRKHSF